MKKAIAKKNASVAASVDEKESAGAPAKSAASGKKAPEGDAAADGSTKKVLSANEKKFAALSDEFATFTKGVTEALADLKEAHKVLASKSQDVLNESKKKLKDLSVEHNASVRKLERDLNGHIKAMVKSSRKAIVPPQSKAAKKRRVTAPAVEPMAKKAKQQSPPAAEDNDEEMEADAEEEEEGDDE